MHYPCAHYRQKNGMDKIKIIGGKPLIGEITVSGAKNAALPAVFACLLTKGTCYINNLPQLRDMQSAFKIIQSMGAACEAQKSQAIITADNLHTCEVPYDWVKTMRASILTLGPLLARFGEAKVSLPGGCAIGARPVDIHLDGLRRMGAKIDVEKGNVIAASPNGRLRGAHIVLSQPTVTGTENLMMAATLAEGETLIENAAREPEINDLAVLLNAMGADIHGADSGNIRICGVTALHGASHAVLPDRIEAGTYLCAVAACGGDVFIRGVQADVMQDLLAKLTASGAKLEIMNNGIRIQMNTRPQAINADTAPYPGFPTDMQAQWMAVCAVADGVAVIAENIFENRFMHVPELSRMGARIMLRHQTATVRGVKNLSGAPMMATDLRASASLVIAGLAANGESIVDRLYHLDRGYDNLVGKLRALGAEVSRIS